MEENKIIEYLDSKFQSWHDRDGRYKKWTMHSWIYYGAEYGLELIYRDNKWTIRQIIDSGYVSGKDIMRAYTWEDIEPLVDSLAPTNKEYKTDRK